jgi:hypothetical protein|tara:strand:- start:601 stop:831 length:231 start_codon:yes stop_codon:yes gene_type:complete
MIDKIRDKSITELENHYAKQMQQMVDELRIEDAEAILSEMIVDPSDVDDVTWSFIDDITGFTNEEIQNIQWHELDG